VGESGQALGVVEGQVVLLADLNIIVDDCSLTPGNRALYANLYQLGSSPTACDMDDDGVEAGHCGGTDCDDCDADADIIRPWYPDVDGDQYGSSDASPVEACAAPADHQLGRV